MQSDVKKKQLQSEDFIGRFTFIILSFLKLLPFSSIEHFLNPNT